MKTLIEYPAGVFQELGNQWLLPLQNLPSGTEVLAGPKLPITCMFDIHQVLSAGVRVGFLFGSQFEVKNGGSYLMTYLHNKGPATEHETLIKDESLVVFHYPNKGTLAISPLVNPVIDMIFDSQ